MPSATLHADPVAVSPAVNLGSRDQGASSEVPAHEAARYAVLRRLSPAIRHQIAGALQPVSMMASMVERRAQKDAPDLESLRRHCTEMSTLARSAGSECAALLGWLAPPQEEPIPAGLGIDECLHLQATELSLRGFTLVNESRGVELLVGRSRMRSLFPAVLLALTDSATRQSEVRVWAQAGPGSVTILFALKPAAEQAEPMQAKGYRRVTWQDVEALAQAEDVECRTRGDGAQFMLPIVVPQPRPEVERPWR